MKKNAIIFSLTIICFFMRVYAQDIENQSPHGELKWDCQVCHTAVSWKKLKDPTDFKHEEAGFPLMGTHKFVDCRSCHQDLTFARVRTDCANCHTDVHQGQFGIDCQSCHTPDNWQNQREIFTMHSERNFPLVGVHAIADCEACHVNQQINEFGGTPVDCKGCHVNDFMLSVSPNHIKANFSTDCQSCHQPMDISWQKATFQHASTTELQGVHLTLDCNSCHVNTYAGTTAECFSCHAGDYNQTNEPSHNTFGFPTDCNICHNQNQWEGTQFDHVQFTGFELRGAHAFILCKDCHVNNQYSGLSQDCFGCHESDYNTVPDPNHVSNAFPTDCMNCHNESSWEQVTFDHNLTQFPLTGAHVTLQCIDCHSGGYANTATDCYSCHQQDFNSTTDPNHTSNNFNLDCTQCHNTNVWSPSTFDHNQTQFPLTGSHVTLECIDCHASGYTGTPTDCYSCHQQDFNSTTDPNHVTNNFSHDCTQCHSTSGWEPAIFDHNQTQFPLTGAHITLECIDCHSSGYTGTPTDCYSCHQQDYNSVSDPDHVANNFNLDCTQCHNTTAWSPATFDHNQTNFPLTGAHLTLECIDCHSSGYTGTPTDCYACHQQDFNGVSDPDHVASNFSHDCTQCHSTSAWSPATFDHNQTSFPLLGAHAMIPCISCHANGYTGTPTDCYSCHQQDYNNTTNPNHQAAGFPISCENCHNSISWNQTTWDHDSQYFPIYSGRHQGEWNVCADCHVNPNNYQVFECIFCHEHNNQQEVNQQHQGVPGYVYQSSACYNCHPDGEAE